MILLLKVSLSFKQPAPGKGIGKIVGVKNRTFSLIEPASLYTHKLRVGTGLCMSEPEVRMLQNSRLLSVAPISVQVLNFFLFYHKRMLPPLALFGLLQKLHFACAVFKIIDEPLQLRLYLILIYFAQLNKYNACTGYYNNFSFAYFYWRISSTEIVNIPRVCATIVGPRLAKSHARDRSPTELVTSFHWLYWSKLVFVDDGLHRYLKM